jgi:hypothetical protein
MGSRLRPSAGHRIRPKPRPARSREKLIGWIASCARSGRLRARRKPPTSLSGVGPDHRLPDSTFHGVERSRWIGKELRFCFRTESLLRVTFPGPGRETPIRPRSSIAGGDQAPSVVRNRSHPRADPADLRQRIRVDTPGPNTDSPANREMSAAPSDDLRRLPSRGERPRERADKVGLPIHSPPYVYDLWGITGLRTPRRTPCPWRSPSRPAGRSPAGVWDIPRFAGASVLGPGVSTRIHQ